MSTPARRGGIHKVCVALRGLHLAVAEELADHFQRRAAADQERGEGMAQVMDADVGQPGVLLHLGPEPANFPDGLADGFAGEEPRIAAWHHLLTQPHDGRDVLRDRDAVDLALLGGRGRLRPDGIVEVELFEPRRPDLTHPGAGQHAHPDDRRGALILGAIQHRRQPG